MKTFLPLVWSCLLLGIHGTAGAAPGDEIYTRPGTLVPADGTRLNLYCMGSGSPAVVFDSGWEDWAPVWTIVQPEVAKWTRACSYDRAGAGFSDPGPMPRTSVRIADELRSALHNAGIEGPYILVGHAFGGDNVRTFAARYPAEVAGLVLVEADVISSPEERRGQARLIASLRECRDAIAAGKPLPALPGRPARTCAQQFFRGLPEAMWSPELNAKLLELAQTKVAMYDAYISEMEQMPQDETYLAEAQPLAGLASHTGALNRESWRPRPRSGTPAERRATEIRARGRPRAGQVARAVLQCQAVIHGQELRIHSIRPAELRRRRNS